MRSELIDIACKVVSDEETKNAIAIIDGTEEEIVDRRTGEIRKRQKWFWLPRSQAEINDDGTVTIPQWLAEDKGLI